MLSEYRKKVESAADYHISEMILYGSYARGDFREDSDIDIMILMDLNETDMKKYEDRIYDITYDFNFSRGTEIMPVIQNIRHFNYWKKAYLFYRNIEEKGILI